jgi:hypothetical protein
MDLFVKFFYQNFGVHLNATNITLDSEPTKTRSSKQEKKTDDSEETGQLT